jgi:N-acetylmuramoyl-L-alanine amidase
MSYKGKHRRPVSAAAWATRAALALALAVGVTYALVPAAAPSGPAAAASPRVIPSRTPILPLFSPTPSPAPSPTELPVPRPHIVWKPIPFGSKRRTEMAAYAARHYGIHTWRIQGPHVIVEHYTASNSFSSTFNYFSTDAPDPELHELPGICAHFVIDHDGTIYQLVPLGTMCRHTVGLNYTAIGIEHVGTSDAQILHNPRQLAASIRLTAWLMAKFHIQLRNVIGHNESLTSPYHKELYKGWRCQTHGDWTRADMVVYRRSVAARARTYGVPLGPPARPAKTGC